MTSRIFDALAGNNDRPTSLFKDLYVGQPFKWVKENASRRNGVCIKLAPISGSFKFTTMEEDYAWTPLENDGAGIVYSNNLGPQEVYPL